MGLFVTSLNSGSNGNCYYIGNEHEAILIDGGISCRETEKRMKRLGLSLKKVKAIFISHEHGDHIHGVPALSKKYQLPVYITPPTLNNGRVNIREELVHPFRAYQPVTIGNFSITAFPKEHDACDPHSFIISSNGITIGVFTDIGVSCKHVTQHFRLCHAAFLESNYDAHMLEKGRYPYHLKNRIRGGKGHLSNDQAMRLFTQHKAPHMSHLFLSHLSRDNNSPELVKKLFSSVANTTEIIIASRDRETDVYHVTPNRGSIKPNRRSKFAYAGQLSLFQ